MEAKKIDDLDLDCKLSSRRDFMKTAGKLALYTPPAIMLLMQPNREAIACSPGQIRRRVRKVDLVDRDLRRPRKRGKGKKKEKCKVAKKKVRKLKKNGHKRPKKELMP